ncbi:ATP-binding protein [Bacillus sp. E214]|uniref:ATP-binding protein n=1 Tax=Bacillus sp. E214 TaxID=2587156 RepID=UPI0011DF76A7|nr:DUF87 domain-containing protein [Bacillus sp. E214]
MKTYINKLNKLIEQNINSSTNASFIRLDYFNHPAIYLGVAVYLVSKFKGIKVLLSEEKVEAWKDEYPTIIKQLKELGFVSDNQRFTKLRNAFGTEKQSIVLLASESVQDTGGLEDFYSITPKDVNAKYNQKFVELFETVDQNDDYAVKIINNLFSSIFKHVPLDLIRVSDIADIVQEKGLYEVDEIVDFILNNLWDEFGIPNIKTVSSKLLSELYKGNSFKLLDSGIKFIKREAYKGGLSSSSQKKLLEKFDKFRENGKFEEYLVSIQASFGSYEKYCNDILDFAKGENLDRLRPKLAQFDQTITIEILGVKTSSTPGKREKAKKIKGDPIQAYSQMLIEVIASLPIELNSSDKLTMNVTNVKLADNGQKNSWSELCIAIGGLLDYLNVEIQDIVELQYRDNEDPFAIKDSSSVNLDFSKSSSMVSKINFEITISGISDRWLFEWLFKPYDYWLQSFNLIPYFKAELSDNNIMKLPVFTCKNIGNLLTSTDSSSFHSQLNNSEILLRDTLKIFKKTSNNGSEENNVVYKLYRLVKPFMKFINTVSEKGIYSAMNINKSMDTVDLIGTYTAVYNELWQSYNSYPQYEKEHFYLISNLFAILEEEDFESLNREIQGAIIPPYHPAMLEKYEAQQSFIRRGLYLVLEEIINTNTNDVKMFVDKFNRYRNKSEILSGVDTLITVKNIHHAPSHVLGYYALHGESTRAQIIDSSYLIEKGVMDELDITEERESNYSKTIIIDAHIKEYIRTFPSSIDSLSLCFVNFEHLYPVIEGIRHYIKEQQKYSRKITLNIDILTPKVNYKAQNYVKMWLDDTFSVDDNIILNLRFNTYNPLEVDKLKEQLQYNSYDLAFVDGLLYTSDIKYQINRGKKIAPSEMKFPMVFNPIPAPNDLYERRVSISQLQFEASFAHSQLVFWSENDFAKENEFYRVEKVLTVQKGMDHILEMLHEKSRWVVSIDTGLDKQLFNKENIISFSTGEGVYGELNVAISASKDMKEDIKNRLESRLRKLFPSWNPNMYSRGSEYCLDNSVILDGIKILKALNPYDYEIHSYLATLFAVQSLNVEHIGDETLLKSFISLDSYNHWFIDQPNRPDLLELEIVRNEGEQLHIKANLVECKMGKENPAHIEKGVRQLENGFEFLSKKFSKDSNDHDRRYWFAQLYRLLAFSPMYLTNDDQSREKLNSDLMKILNGEFIIEWKTTLLTYWLDYNAEEINVQESLLKGTDITLQHRAYGQLYIQKCLLPEEQRETVTFENALNEEFEIFVDDENSFKEYLKELSTKEKVDYEDEPYEVQPTNPGKTIKEIKNNSIGQSINDDENKKNDGQSEIDSKGQENHLDNKDDKDDKKFGKELDPSNDNTDNDYVKPLNEIRILLGKEQRTNREIYWEYGHPKLENRHLLITGTSGVGKTYFMQCLLLELANNGVSTLIFDYTDGFKKSQLNDDFKEAMGDGVIQFNVQRSGFPVNPFKRNYKEYDEDEFDLESEIDVAERVAGIFYSVYKKNGIGDQQKNAIYKATLNGLQKYGEKMNLDYLRSELELLDKGSAKTVLSKIDPLIDRKPFATENLFDWEDIPKSNGKVFIVQLTGFDRFTQVLLTEFILWDIWSYNISHGNVETPFPVILDEAQNLDQSENSPSARILTEGRKFGWSGLFATQSLQHPITKDAITRFQNASQKVHFLPPEGDNRNIASFLSPDSTEQKIWATKLAKLAKGQCIVVGGNRLADGSLGHKSKHIIDVTPLYERKNKK